MKKKFQIKGMSCTACVAHVEKAVKKLNDVSNVNVNLLTNTLELETENVSDEKIIQAVIDAGYYASVYRELSYQKKSNLTFYKLLISIVFLLLLLYVSMGAMFNFPLPKFLNDAFIFALSQIVLLIPIVILNFHYFISGYKKIFKGAPNMDSLVAIGSSAAILYGIYATIMIKIALINNDMELLHKFHMELYFEGAGSILTLVSIGKYIEANSKSKTSNAISLLLDLSGKEAILIKDDAEKIVNVEELKLNDIIKVNAGMSIPVDGIILKGNGSVDESSLTGESIPVFKKENDSVISGTILKDGTIYYKALSTSKDSTLAKIVALVEEAASSKAPIARLADKVSGVFVPCVIAISLISFLIWILTSKDFAFSIGIAISVLVISCPCALGLATPIAIMISTGIAAKNHILIKDAESLENLHNINVVVMDKTGTITKGELKVKEYKEFDNNFLTILKSLENNSSHPIALSILNELKDVEVIEVNNIKTIPGKGINAEINNKTYYAGNLNYILENCHEQIDIENDNSSIVIVCDNEHILGYIEVIDEVKNTSKLAIQLFKKQGIKTIMLTGDNLKNAEYIKEIVDVDEVIANVLPDQKATVINKLKEKYKVLMIGDGINDSIALQSADVAMAVKKGSDIAIESANIVLIKNDLLDAYNAYLLSKKTINNIKMNLFWAFFYNAISIPIAAGVLYPFFQIKLNPMIAALAMSLSSICVVTNALRLNKFKKEEVKNMEKVIVVEGMMCSMCKKHVEDAIKKVVNVIDVDANIKTKKVSIQYENDLNLNDVVNAITEAGYQVK